MTPLLVALAAAAVFEFPAWPLAESDVEQLKGGLTLVRDFEVAGVRGAIVRFFVRAQAATCYRELADVPGMAEYMPGLRSVRVVEDRGLAKVLEYRSQVPLVADFTLLRRFEPETRISWSKIKAPYKRIDGEWRFFPVSGGTVLSYSLGIETGHLVPSWVAVEFQKQGTFQLARNVRRRIESGGKWVRPDYDAPTGH